MTDNLIAAAILDDPYLGFVLLASLVALTWLLHELWWEPRQAAKAEERERERIEAIGRELAELRRAGNAARFGARQRRVH